jgi:hypothetical protein
MLFGQFVTFLCKRDVDDPLAALILVENDLVVVGSALALPARTSEISTTLSQVMTPFEPASKYVAANQWPGPSTVPR